jgi:hypothetical protein
MDIWSALGWYRFRHVCFDVGTRLGPDITRSLGGHGCGVRPLGRYAEPSSESAAAGSCASGDAPGQIDGQSKCLQDDQRCQVQWASDYNKYGFECTKNNGQYELKTKSK